MKNDNNEIQILNIMMIDDGKEGEFSFLYRKNGNLYTQRGYHPYFSARKYEYDDTDVIELCFESVLLENNKPKKIS